MKPVFISYYTLGTGYKEEADRLIESCSKFNLIHDVEGVENLGSWQKNTLYKATHILKMLCRYGNQPIVFLDADAEIIRQPKLLFDIPEDIHLAVHYRNWRLNPHELLSGTMYFKNDPLVKEFVIDWIKWNIRYPTMWEQKNLNNLLNNKWKDYIKIKELPFSYCHIFDDPREKKPVITHYQASRRLKHKIK